MNWRKNMMLVVGGGICLVLFIISGYFLVKFRADYMKVSAKVKVAQTRLDQLNQRDPFPSDANVGLAQTNLVKLHAYFKDLMDNLQREQGDVEPIEAADFAPLLEKAKQRLQKRALEAGVKMPDRFGLGFDRYARGDLPSTDAIPRLVVQMKAVEAVLIQLFDARVSEILAMERDVFEAPSGAAEEAAGASRRRGRGASAEAPLAKALQGLPPLETNELYSAERIYVSLTARESSVWQLLNSLAMTRPFIMVSDVKILNPLDLAKRGPAAPVAKPVSGAVAAPGVAGIKPPVVDREDRVVAGREPVKVDLVLEVYRFIGAAPQEGKP
ncbi:MAG: Amuc_1100 family pilus-like protein [bacterium]